MHTGLIPFLSSIMTKRSSENEVIEVAIRKTEEDMLANGIVAVGDISNTAFTISQKQNSRLRYINLLEVAGLPEPIAHSRYESIPKKMNGILVSTARSMSFIISGIFLPHLLNQPANPVCNRYCP